MPAKKASAKKASTKKATTPKKAAEEATAKKTSTPKLKAATPKKAVETAPSKASTPKQSAATPKTKAAKAPKADSAAARMPATEAAAAALLGHLSKSGEKDKKAVLIDEAGPVFLGVTLMQSLPKTKSMKRTTVLLPHGIHNREDQECCLITTSPQRAWKDKVQPLPQFKNVKKIIDVNKLRKKFKAYEEKRQLATQFNFFLADEAVVTFLPKILGKTFFQRSKEPVLVNMKKFPESLEEALASTSYSIQDNVNVSILIGNTDFTPAELAANAFAVMESLTQQCPNGWREISCAMLKGSNSPALHIYAHNYPESVANPITPNAFPKRQRLSVPADDEKPSKKQKREEPSESEAEDGDESVDLSDLDDISDVDDEESA